MPISTPFLRSEPIRKKSSKSPENTVDASIRVFKLCHANANFHGFYFSEDMLMRLKNPTPLMLDRVRSIPQSFSWIDRRILTKNFLPYLSGEEIGLYFFLVAASDRYGMSFYGTSKICHALGVTEEQFQQALTGLQEMDLVAYRFPFFQVLSLPDRPNPSAQRLHRVFHRRNPK